MADGIWLIDGPPARDARLPLPTRSTLVRLDDGALWLYAPVGLTPDLRAQIDALGRLAHLVAPAPTSIETLPDWVSAFPEARLWAPAGVAERIAAAGLDVAMPHELRPDRAEEPWQDDLRQLVVEGNPDHPEAVFFHRVSDTLIVHDLISAVETVHLSSWLRPVIWLAGLDDAVGRMPRWLRRGFRDEAPLVDAVERMIGWGPRRIILNHGRWYRRDGVGELERAFRKILRERQWEKALQQMRDDAR